MAVIKPAIIENSAVGFEFGLQFKLRQVLSDGNRSEVRMIRGDREDVFYGLFDEQDIDFEVIVDNQSSAQNILFKLNIENKEQKSYYIKSREKSVLKALETNGRHLHFVSQETEPGKTLVAMSADKNNMSYEEAAIRYSRIGFNVEIEKPKDMTRGQAFSTDDKIDIFIRTRTKTSLISLSLSCTVEQVKTVVMNKFGINSNCSSLIWKGTTLRESQTLSQLGVPNGDTIWVAQLYGGTDDCAEFDCPSTSLESQTKNSFGSSNQLGLPRQINTRYYDIYSDPEPTGERGVVCFGQQTDQRFETYRGFEASPEFRIKSFTIELRMKPKYSLN